MPTETFQNLPEDKRRRIVEAAIVEFSEHSYRQASLNRIVRAAEISKGSLYQYFADKADLFRWLVTDELVRRKLACIAETPLRGEGLYAELERAIRGGLAFSAREPRVARMAAQLIGPVSDPDLQDLIERSREISHAWMLGLLTEAREHGEIREGVDLGLAARFLLQVLGVGILDVLLHEMGIDLPTFLSHSDVHERLDDETLDRLVGQCLGFVRLGLTGVER